MRHRHRNFAILAAVTVLAVAGAFYDYHSEKKSEETKREKSRILTMQTDQINQIEISTTSAAATTKNSTPVISNKIKLVKSPDGWKLEEPIQELADQSAVSDFAEGLTTEFSEETLLDGKQIDWKVFGLDEPRGQITVQNTLGEKTTIAVSSKKNYQGEAFLRRNQEQKVLLASNTWFAKLEKKPMDFRDRRLLRKPLAQATGLDIESESGKFSLKFADQKWSPAEHPAWHLDQNKVSDFLSTLTNPIIIDFTKEAPATADERKTWGLTKPRATLKIRFKEGPVWQAALGRDADADNRVEMSDPAFVVKIAAADAAKLADLGLDSLRDRHEPFAFDRMAVKHVEIHSGKGTSIFEMQGDKWEPVQKAWADLKVDSNKVTLLLIRLEELKVVDYGDGLKNLPTGKSPISLVLKDADGKILLDMKIGDQKKKKILSVDHVLLAAQTQLFNEPFWIDAMDLKSTGLADLAGQPVDSKEVEKR